MRQSLRSAAVWFWAGIFFFLSLPLISFFETSHYSSKEAWFGFPIPTPENKAFLRSDGYGKGFFGASRNGGRLHKGVDLEAPVGTEVRAAKSGRVLFAGEEKGGYGKYLVLLHPEGLATRYAHLSDYTAFEGAWAVQGQLIGHSGRTGNADNPKIKPHLHFEIRYKDAALDPAANLMDPAISLK